MPIPTFPFCPTYKLDPVVPPTKRVEVAMREPTVEVPEVRALPCTENDDVGVVVPTASVEVAMRLPVVVVP